MYKRKPKFTKPIIEIRECVVCCDKYFAKAMNARYCQKCRDNNNKISDKRLLEFALKQLDDISKEDLTIQFIEYNKNRSY